MKYTTTSPDLFQHLQMNAGIIVEEFNPETGEFNGILGATTGGVAFNAAPEFTDFGEDIDNIPANMLELKKQSSVAVTVTGTFVSVTAALAKQLIGAADSTAADGVVKIIPRKDLAKTDFKTVWFVGDYSDVNTGGNAGYLAVKVLNALSTGGFQMQTTDDGKGNFAFELTGHYTLDNQDKVPYEVYIKQGSSTPEPEADATLSSLAIGELILTPAFDADTAGYIASTTNTSDTVTAVASATGAAIAIRNGDDTVENGSAATWSEGNNTVTVTVTNGTVTKTYTVTVTKS